jgi:hypothetical protein
MSSALTLTMPPMATIAGAANSSALLGECRRGDHRHGLLRVHPSCHQSSGDRLEIAETHIEHDGLTGPRQRAPIDLVLVTAAMAGDENQRLIDAANGRGDRGHGQRREAGGYARDDAERDAGLGQSQSLLSTAAEHARIAALKAKHAMARARERNEAVRDARLRRRGLAAALPSKFEGGTGIGQRQHARIDEGVVDDDIGLGETGKRLEREQRGIAGACAGEPHLARFEHRQLRRRGFNRGLR